VKELAARFRAVNPKTHFQAERAQKWFQGRALPRSLELYDDWAKVLGISKSGAWLEAAKLDEFAAELSSVCNLTANVLLGRAEAHASIGLTSRPDPGSALSYISGTYACYSAAWCTYYRGRLIRGAMQLNWRSGASGSFAAEYTEALLGRVVHYRGELFAVGRALHLDLRRVDDRLPLFGSFVLPGPPASLLCGIVSGSTAVGPDPQPSAARMLMVRVAVRPDASNRYLDSGDTVSGDLATLGIDIADVEEGALREFLQPSGVPGVQQVSVAGHVRLTTPFDELYLSRQQWA
jgi:hypothetical protein